jgi:hypothetical protein
MADIGPFVAEAFMAGYTKHGTPDVTVRAWTCSHMLLWFAEDNAENPNVLAMVESQAELEGLYNQIFVRRDHLWQTFDILVHAWAKKLSLFAPYDRIVSAANAADNQQDQSTQNRDAIRAAIIAVLQAILAEHPNLAAELRDIGIRATLQAHAEGNAVAVALLALLHNQPVPDLQELVAASLKKAKHDHGVQQGVNQFVSAAIAGMAGDAANLMVPAIHDGAPDDVLSDKAKTAVATGAGPAFYTDNHIQATLILAGLAAYRRNAVGRVNWITMGDSKVCPQCLALEAGGPYLIPDLPASPPAHGNCRCFLSPLS